MSVTTLSLFRFDRAFPRISLVASMPLSRMAMARDPRLKFWKLCGSGTEQGFTPKPNWGVWAILAVWPDEATARAGVCDSPVWARWRKSCDETWTIFLRPTTARGSWAGVNPFRPDVVAGGETDAAADAVAGSDAAPPQTETLGLAALTRATLRPTRAMRFWNRVPDISTAIGADPNVIFKIGIGEMPLLHQATFSIWPDARSMAHFARGNCPHGDAIRAVREEHWFSEELYARFAVIGQIGTWEGKDPLAPLATRAEQRKDAA